MTQFKYSIHRKRKIKEVNSLRKLEGIFMMKLLETLLNIASYGILAMMCVTVIKIGIKVVGYRKRR